MSTGADEFQKAVCVSRETIQRLDRYARLLSKWNTRINLVSPATIDDLWTRHFLDSAQLFDLSPRKARRWVDLGSGGGFPGLVIAVLALEKYPQLQVFCIESDKRKAIFLSTVARELDVNATILSERIEKVVPMGADVVSARALASLDTLFSMASRHLSPSGTALFLKGINHADEISQAQSDWVFDMSIIPSKTDTTGVILKVGDLARA